VGDRPSRKEKSDEPSQYLYMQVHAAVKISMAKMSLLQDAEMQECRDAECKISEDSSF
jgi:carbamoylphosphate synthase large subunit